MPPDFFLKKIIEKPIVSVKKFFYQKKEPKWRKVRLMKSLQREDSWSGEFRIRERRSRNPKTGCKAETKMQREKEVDEEGERKKEGIGEWDFVGDSLSPAVSSEPIASELLNDFGS